jgi:hypothetical protein
MRRSDPTLRKACLVLTALAALYAGSAAGGAAQPPPPNPNPGNEAVTLENLQAQIAKAEGDFASASADAGNHLGNLNELAGQILYALALGQGGIAEMIWDGPTTEGTTYVTELMNYNSSVAAMEKAEQALQAAWAAVAELDSTSQTVLDAWDAAVARSEKWDDVLEGYGQILAHLGAMDAAGANFGVDEVENTAWGVNFTVYMYVLPAANAAEALASASYKELFDRFYAKKDIADDRDSMDAAEKSFYEAYGKAVEFYNSLEALADEILAALKDGNKNLAQTKWNGFAGNFQTGELNFNLRIADMTKAEADIQKYWGNIFKEDTSVETRFVAWQLALERADAWEDVLDGYDAIRAMLNEIIDANENVGANFGVNNPGAMLETLGTSVTSATAASESATTFGQEQEDKLFPDE